MVATSTGIDTDGSSQQEMPASGRAARFLLLGVGGLAPTISVDFRGVGVLAPTISVDSERHGASIVMLVATISVDLQRHAVQLQIDTDGSHQQETPANGGAARFLLLGVGVLAPTINVDSRGVE